MIKHNILANYVGKFWTALMSFLFVPLYIKFIGIESYGLVGVFASLQAIFGLLDMGLSTTLNRELARLSASPETAHEMRDLVRTLELVYWGIALLMAVTIFGLSTPLAYYWVNSVQVSVTTVHHAILLMGGIIAFQWPLRFYAGGLMGIQKQVLLNIIDIGAMTVRAIGAIFILSHVSPTIQAFFIWQFVVSGIHTSLTALFLWNRLPKAKSSAHFQKQMLVRIWHFAAGLTGISILTLLLSQVDKILLSKLLSLEKFGYFTLATFVATTLYRFIEPIYSAVFPRLSQLVSLQDENGLTELYHASCQGMAVMIIPPSIVLALFSSEILLLWTGNAITVEHTYQIVTLYITGTALNGLLHIPYALQLAYGWTTLALYSNIFAVILLIPLIVVLVSLYGAIGAAIAWIILNIGYVFVGINIMHTRLLTGQKWRWCIDSLGKPLVPALTIAVIWRIGLSNSLSRGAMLLYLAGVSMTTFCAAGLATPFTRSWLVHRLIQFKQTL